ncbi:MAG: lipopolysaccharide transport periplasmic protein LptA [Thermodesulfovibrionales bacterium]|nr:lipopolysaccharide transport periplasmic protein LptA [Thermodesulfovibrionales bacterium]
MKEILGILLIIFTFSISQAAEEKKSIVITSESLTINKKENQAIFSGRVIAKKDELTIFADTMIVYYDNTGTKVEIIEATGNIKVLKGTRTILSEKAVYKAEEDSITFTGEPVAMDGKNIIKGDKIIYYISEDRSVVSNSKVFLKESVQ